MTRRRGLVERGLLAGLLFLCGLLILAYGMATATGTQFEDEGLGFLGCLAQFGAIPAAIGMGLGALAERYRGNLRG